MKSFTEYRLTKEEVVPAIFDARQRNDVSLESVRDSINAYLSTEKHFPTPYIALEKMRKVLANFHISIPGTNFLEGDKGMRVWEVEQYGHKYGENQQGEVVTKGPDPYYIYFEYDLFSGSFYVDCALVDEKEMNERTARWERLQNARDSVNEGLMSGLRHATGAKTNIGAAAAGLATLGATAAGGALAGGAGFRIAGATIAGAYALRKLIQRARSKNPDLVEEKDKEFLRKQYSKAYADSAGKMTDDGKKLVKKRMKELSDNEKLDEAKKVVRVKRKVDPRTRRNQKAFEKAFGKNTKSYLDTLRDEPDTKDKKIDEAKLTSAERRAMLDARRMEASTRGRKVIMPKIKVTSPKQLKKISSVAADEFYTMGRSQRIHDRTAALMKVYNKPNETKQPSRSLTVSTPAPLPREIAPVVHAPTPTVRRMPRPDVVTEFEKHIAKYQETGNKVHLKHAHRAAMSHYAKHYQDFPDEAETEKNRKLHVIDQLKGPSILQSLKKFVGLKEAKTTESLHAITVHYKNKNTGNLHKEQLKVRATSAAQAISNVLGHIHAKGHEIVDYNYDQEHKLKESSDKMLKSYLEKTDKEDKDYPSARKFRNRIKGRVLAVSKIRSNGYAKVNATKGKNKRPK